jgi:hypothetical protein
MGCVVGGGINSMVMRLTPQIEEKIQSSVKGNVEAERPVTDYPFYGERFTPIDYEKIIKDGVPWSDPYFKADRSALIEAEITAVDKHTQRWEKLVWKRPSEVYGKDFRIFSNISPTDIKQGSCADCYFLSSISSLAEFPERI